MKRITRLILTLLVLLSAFSMAGFGKIFPKSDELLSVVNKDFEIYAPRPADLERASEAVVHARSVYQKYFGKEAPKIALVLFDTPDQASAYTESKFKERGLALLKHMAAHELARSGFSPELGVVFAEVPSGSGPQVLGIVNDQPPAGIKLKKGDVFLAVNNRTVANQTDFLREIKAAAVSSEMTLRIKREGRETEIKYKKPPVSEPDASMMEKVHDVVGNSKVPTSKTIIAHEAMHTLMGAGLKTHAIPAWYSEGLASLAEYPEVLKPRRLKMKENVKDASPTATLLTMLHPASYGQIVPSSQAPGATAPGMPVTIRLMNTTKAQDLFYEQSMTLLEFLAETEGDRFVGRIGESLARGESMESILKTASKAPTDITQLEIAWAKWLSRQ